MGLVKFFILSSVIGVAAYFAYNCCDCLHGSPPVPAMKSDQWWGPGNAKKLGDGINPFKINVSNKVIEDLNQQLDRYLRRSPTPPLEGQGFEYGFNTNYLKEVVTYWRNKYKWQERQAFLNKFPQYKTSINGLDIHFLMVKPTSAQGKKVLPLLLLHGWPGSVREFYDIIPMLTTPKPNTDFVFQVIVPSLPGYGFSSGAAKPGMGHAEIAVLMKNLMTRLGFDQFYVQGGDWGSVIAKDLGILYPNSVLGVHSNFCMVNTFMSNVKWFLGSLVSTYMVEAKYRHKMYPMKDVFKTIMKESGYFHLQSTKPDTIGIALGDTPVGLAAYILEKFSTWTSENYVYLQDGGLTKKFTLDALLDNIMIYWISGSITTSQRLYSEAFSANSLVIEKIPIQTPTACARFVNELLWQTKCQLKEKYKNLIQVTDFDEGGHFAAFEVPKLLSQDVWTAVEKFENHHRSPKS